jgi:hypothetical protein
LEKLESVCKDAQSVVLVADATNHQDLAIAQAFAVKVTEAPNAYALLVNIGESPDKRPTEFTNMISMCSGFKQELLDALLDGLLRLQIEPGWVGVDIHDLAAALESTGKCAFAVVGIASGNDQGKSAALAAVSELDRCGQSLIDATGAVAMLAINGVGLKEVKAAMNAIRERIHPDAPVAYCCHDTSGPPGSLRVTLIASAKYL